MKSVWNKLKQNRISVTRIGPLVFVFFVFFTKIVSAADSGGWFDVGGWIGKAVGWLGEFFVSIISLFLTIAQTLFQAALMYNLRFGDKLEVIKIGWGISRDVANIFFIVVLLVIAIATILRVGSYAAKQLLPGLIIMAILINFSLTIGLVVVDVSNTLGLQFYNAITDNNTKTVSELIMTGTGLQNVFNFTPADPGQLKAFEDGILQNTGPSLDKYKQADVLKDVQRGDPWAFAITAWGNAVFMMILVFVFFTATFILLARVAMISVLLMLAPLAFLFYILPDTKSHFSKWWSTLIQQCFMLPAFLFLLYLAIVLILKIGLANKGANPGNFISNPGLIFGYIMAVILLLQALILGRSMGGTAAETSIKWGRAGRKMATGFVAGQTIGRASERALSSQGVKDFIERRSPWIGRRLQGYLEKGAAAGGRQKSAEATAAFVSRQTATDQAKAWEKMSFAEKQALLRKLNTDQRRGLIDNLPDEQKKLAERILGTSLAADQKADMDASQYQKLPENTKAEKDAKDREFALLSRGAKERVLRTMNDSQKADLAERLRAANIKNTDGTDTADQLEDIVKKDFTPTENDAYVVARENKKTLNERIASFIDQTSPNKLTDRQRAAVLLSMDADTRRNFIEEVDKAQVGPPIPGTQLVNSEQIMQDYFSPEKLMEHKAVEIDKEKDSTKKAALYDALEERQKEFYLTKRLRDEGQRAKFLATIDPAKQQAARDLLKMALSPVDFAKIQAVEHSKKTKTEQKTEFGATEDIVLEEYFKANKNPSSLWNYYANLDPADQPRAISKMRAALSRDEFDDFMAYYYFTQPEADRVPNFLALTEQQQVKTMRNIKGESRAGLLLQLASTSDGLNAANNILYNHMTQIERDTMQREMCPPKKRRRP